MSRAVKRIAFDATNILGHGGIKTYARQLIRALAVEDPRCSLMLFTTGNRNKLDRLREVFEDLGNVSVHTGLPHARMLGDGLRRLADLAGALAWRRVARRVDLVHLTDPFSSCGMPVNCISTVHDLFPLTRPEHAGTPLRREYFRRTPGILARSSSVIVPSEYVSTEVSRLYPRWTSRLCVVPDAASDMFVPRSSQVCGDDEPPYFLFVGRPDLRKNLPRILEAFGRIRGELPGVGLKLVLSGPPSLHEVPDDPTVEVLRDISITDLVTQYSSALALVFPSLDEGFGLPLLEAMRCGCPVIASRTGSLPEVAGEAGLLVDPLDVEGIASAMAGLAGSMELRERLALAGLERASLFTWRRTAQETLRIYRR